MDNCIYNMRGGKLASNAFSSSPSAIAVAAVEFSFDAFCIPHFSGSSAVSILHSPFSVSYSPPPRRTIQPTSQICLLTTIVILREFEEFLFVQIGNSPESHAANSLQWIT